MSACTKAGPDCAPLGNVNVKLVPLAFTFSGIFGLPVFGSSPPRFTAPPGCALNRLITVPLGPPSSGLFATSVNGEITVPAGLVPCQFDRERLFVGAVGFLRGKPCDGFAIRN